MTPEKLQDMLAQRGDPAVDPQSLLAMTGGEAATVAGSRAYRMTVAVEFGSGRRGAEVVILLLESGDEPYRVLSWRNASDGGVAPQRAS
jgi:general secretion pathway protein K